MLYGGEDRSKS